MTVFKIRSDFHELATPSELYQLIENYLDESIEKYAVKLSTFPDKDSISIVVTPIEHGNIKHRNIKQRRCFHCGQLLNKNNRCEDCVEKEPRYAIQSWYWDTRTCKTIHCLYDSQLNGIPFTKNEAINTCAALVSHFMTKDIKLNTSVVPIEVCPV